MFKYIAILHILFLSSCSVGENLEHYTTIKDKDVQETLNLSPNEITVKNNWYEIFNDNDLNTLLKHALSTNFSVKQGVERLKQSRLDLAIQSKEYYPKLDISADYKYNKSRNKTSYSYNINDFSTGFNVTWELDLWGKSNYVSEQYYQIMKNVEYSLFNIKTSVTAEIISNYINLRLAQEKLRIANKNLTLQNDILQTIKNKHASGIVDLLALNQAEYTVQKTKSTIPPLKIQIEKYKNSIATLLGITPNKMPLNLDKYNKNITSYTFKYNTKKLYNLPLNVIRSRPDVMSAEASILSQNAVINEAITNLYPSLNLSASFGFISSSANNIFNSNNQNYGYSPGLTLPIWHWNQLKNNVELQKHIREEYIVNYNEIMLTALMELKTIIKTIEQSYITNQYTKNAFNKMQNIMELTKNKYSNGLIEFTDVAQAEQDLLNAQNILAESNAEILQNITNFYKATGGGYNIITCKN